MARRRGTILVEHEDVAAGSVLPLLADDAVRAFADGLLRKLHEHDAHGRGDLVASLRAWLSRHGQWDAAAADLGVHRHTLRYRMRRVEEILGRSLDDPDVRMELWLALKATSGDPTVGARGVAGRWAAPAAVVGRRAPHPLPPRSAAGPPAPASGAPAGRRADRTITIGHAPPTVGSTALTTTSEGPGSLCQSPMPLRRSGSPAGRPPARTPSTSPPPGTAGSSAR